VQVQTVRAKLMLKTADGDPAGAGAEPPGRGEDMRRLGLMSALGLTGLSLIGLLSAAPAGAQTTCEWYARTAVKQQQENEQRKCGFKGQSWTSDLKSHLTWCAGVSPDEWKRQAQKRDQELAACGKK
jgi:hypothetical protein